MDMIETIKNLANILFFVVVAIISVLSYIQARKTLFAPIRTETFKLQLKAFEEILLFFQNKSETDFSEAFDFHRIVSLNALQMADEYVEKFFADKIGVDKDLRSEILKPLIGALVSREYMGKYFEKMDAETPVVKAPGPEKKIDNPAIILANWQRYEHGMVGFTKEYNDQLKELMRLSASPLVPRPLREKIGKFQELAHDNLVLVGETITKCAKLMPEHFPVVSDMKDFTPDWVWNEFNEKGKKYEPLAKEILAYMNNYLNVECLTQ